ncbi:MAG: GDP-mannose 4,6-dehydratase, partial [Flavobacteriales bacterium]|nr:GDP-mannose 4,6-dehydratase [Flavobacteriales bacterium]
PFINGDGEQSRDFTFVENAVQANIRGMFSQVPGASNRVYNIAFGEKTTVNQLYFDLKDLVGSEVNPTYRDPRKGDVQDSLADISKAQTYLGYNPQVSIKDGLEVTLKWFAANYGPTR